MVSRMKKINLFLDRLYNFVPGYVFGILAFIIGFFGDIIALLLSPEYVMWEKSISILGHNPGGVFMRGGLIISSFIAIPFIIYLGRALKDENINENMRKIAIGSGIFASITAMLTGTFSGVNEFISFLHGLFALVSWIAAVIIFLFFALLMLKNSKFSKNISYFNLVIAGILSFYLVPFFTTNFCNLFPNTSAIFSFGRSVYQIMPVTEWLVMLSILFWYLINAIYILNKKL